MLSSSNGSEEYDCMDGWFGLWCLMPLSTILLYCGSQFYWWRKSGENHRKVTDKLTAEDRIRCKLGKTVLDT